MKVTDLLGAHVATEGGEQLGIVHDLRAEVTPRSLTVTGLVVGRLGVLERLGIGAPGSAARIRTKNVIPWADVVRVTGTGITVRDDTRLRERLARPARGRSC